MLSKVIANRSFTCFVALIATASLIVVGTTPASAATVRKGLPANCSTAKPKIGVALPNLSNPYYVYMKKGVELAAKAAGFQAIISIANDDIATQQSQIDSFVQAKVCAVYLNAIGSDPGTGFAAKISKAGIPVFAVNVFLDEAAVKKAGGKIIQNLGADQAGGGTLSGEQVLKNLGATAKIVAGIAGVPSNVTTNLRDSAFTTALKKNPNASVTQTVDTQVKPDVAQQVVAEMLQGNPAINVIFADTGPGMVGALLAIKQLKKESSVQLYGFCPDNKSVPAIVKPFMGCVGQAPQLYGELAIKEIKKYISGKSVKKLILVPTPVFNEGDKVPDNIIG